MTTPASALAPAPDTARALRIIWAAFVAAAVVYAIIPFLLSLPASDALPPEAHGAIYSSAAGAAVASFLTRRWWLNSVRGTISDAQAHGADPAARRIAAGTVEARVKAGAIVTWALSEVVGIIGLVGSLLSRQPSYGLPLAAIAVLLLVLHRPAVWPVDAASALS